MKYLFALFLFSLFCFSYMNGEELSLAELVDIALENNPETEKVWAGVRRSQSIIGITKAKEYPHVDAQGSIAHSREVKFPNGPNTVFTNYGGELNLNYLLCDFGENRAAVRAAKEGLSASKWWADFSIQKVIAEVASNYYELLNARELFEAKEISLQEAQLILEASKELRDAGLRSANDYYTVKAQVSEILMNLTQQKAASSIAYAKLMISLGVSVDTKLDVQTKPKGIENPLFKGGVENLLIAAQEQRADLMAKQASLAAMNAHVDRAKRAPLPKLRALGQSGWMEYGKHQGNGYNYSAGIALEVPIFKGFEYTYQKRHALANAGITSAELRELQNAVALEVLTYSETLKAASESMLLSEDFFDDALKSYEGSLESYKAGLINIFDLLQSQGRLADARNRKAQAKTMWLVSLSQLAFATGSNR